MVQTYRTTLEEFERFISLPENDDRLFEYIEGEIVEVVTNSYSSEIAANIMIRLGGYVLNQRLGHITGEAGGYQMGNNRYLPNVGFISKKRMPESPRTTFIPIPPDLAVEVVSPTDRPQNIRTKMVNYMNAGIVVWLVDPDEKEVEVYAPGQSVKTFRIGDTLDGGGVLLGFILAVKDIFDF